MLSTFLWAQRPTTRWGGRVRTPWFGIAVCLSCAEQLAPEAVVVSAPVPEASPQQAEPLAPETAKAEIDDVIQRIQDVAFYHERERVDEAATLWHQAFERWATMLRGPLAAADPEAALAIEYRFGSLRTALEARRGKPKAVSAELEAALRASAWRLTGEPAPAPPPTPPVSEPAAPDKRSPPATKPPAPKSAPKSTPPASSTPDAPATKPAEASQPG